MQPGMSVVRIPKVSYGLKTGAMPEGKLFSSLFITEGILVYVSALISLRFEVLMVVSIKKNVFWHVMPCSLLDRCQHFGGICCLHVTPDHIVLQARRVNFTV